MQRSRHILIKTDAIVKETQRLLVSQGNAPTCGHNSCVMVLDTLGKKVDVKFHHPTKHVII